LDILINNAGISIRKPFFGITPSEWNAVTRDNLDGVFYVAQQAARRMVRDKGGVILNMGSTNGIMGYPWYASYNASKAGVIELSRSMALELAPKVRVNAVCPGYILTPMQEAEYTPEMLRACSSKIPLGRGSASPKKSPGFSLFWHQTMPGSSRVSATLLTAERLPAD
jgi:meso-butanediol dehydrogenase/(S,S)-butanediol dehydrogenase/diacetyl reductase